MGKGFHQAMLTVFVAHAVNLHDEERSSRQDNSDTHISRQPDNVHHRKDDEQDNYTTSQIPDVLCFQA